jgi:hypothetical protein
MKTFMYFENQEGGMAEWEVREESDLIALRGWKDSYCYNDDKHLEEWMKTAEIGDLVEHRLGVMVRVKDTEERSQ